jgi:hypothetical protein
MFGGALLFFAFIAALFVATTRRTLRIRAGGVTTVGRILSTKYHAGNGYQPATWSAEVEYRDTAGQMVTKRFGVGKQRPTAETVQVIFNPNKPRRAVLDVGPEFEERWSTRAARTWAIPLVFALPGLLLVLLAPGGEVGGVTTTTPVPTVASFEDLLADPEAHLDQYRYLEGVYDPKTPLIPGDIAPEIVTVTIDVPLRAGEPGRRTLLTVVFDFGSDPERMRAGDQVRLECFVSGVGEGNVFTICGGIEFLDG